MAAIAAASSKTTNSGSRLRRLRTCSPSLVLAVCLTIVLAIRCCSVLRHHDMGCDMATYLATIIRFFGQDPTGFGLDRPPLIALPLKVLALVFGDLNGVRLLGILLSVAIGIPFYFSPSASATVGWPSA